MGRNENVKLTAQISFGKRYDHVLPKKSTRTHSEELLVEISTIELKIFWEKKVKYDENSNSDKLGCRGRSAFGSSAKHT